MKYLITGITGFAGPHLANLLLQEGHEVFGLLRCSNGREVDITDIVSESNFNRIKFLYSDLTNHRTLVTLFKENSFDGVFHLAAQSHPPTSFVDPIGTFDSNIMGTANLIQAIVDNQPECKLMFCSTSEVYGNIGSDKRKITTDDKLFPANPYGVSKASTDLYMQERMENGKLRGFITRAFSHTGPRRGKNFSISCDANHLASMMLGEESRTLSVGNLDTVRVVMDVRDCVNAYYLLMINDASDGKVFNVCGDTPRPMGFFTDKLIEKSGLDGIDKWVNPKYYRPIDINYQDGDASPLKALTGWECRYSIDETLLDLLDYWFKKLS
jgi:GDP-4-dehydro-6-deoxy-D-mannose reductase